MQKGNKTKKGQTKGQLGRERNTVFHTANSYVYILYLSTRLGYVYSKEGKIDDALSMFSRASEINRLDMDIYLYKGRMYEEIGKPEEAAKAYRQALELVLSLEHGQ